MKNKSVLDKYKGLTFSEASKAIGKRYKYRDVDSQEMAAYKAELKQLQKAQDMKRLEIQSKEVLKYGGKLKQYNLGTPSTEPIGYLDLKTITRNYGVGQIPFDSMENIEGRHFADPKYARKLRIPEEVGTIVNFLDNPSPTPSLNIGDPETALGKSGKKLLNPKNKDKNIFTPALIGKGIETGINVSQLAGGYDKFDPIENPNASDVDRLMAGRGVDRTQVKNQILSAYNASRANSNRARSANVATALDTNALTQEADAMAKTELDTQNINLGLQADYASTLNNLGQQSVQARNTSRMLNAQSKGNFQTEISKLGMNIADSTKFISDVRTNKQNQQTIANVLNMKYSHMGIDTSVTDRLLSGKLTDDDIIKLKSAIGTEETNTIIEAFKVN